MRDRQVFAESTLPNGIKVYQYPEKNTPYTYVILHVPVGLAHSTGQFIPGTFHFLEHIVALRSTKHPDKNEFIRLVGSKGGAFNAGTAYFHTCYMLLVPTKNLAEVLPGFFSQIFEPIFNKNDIEMEQGVINNERKRLERWFPGRDEVEHYWYTKWQRNCKLSLRQRLGEQQDLARMTSANLAKAHQFYRNPRVRVLAGGSGDIGALLGNLASLPMSDHPLPYTFDPACWENQEYHEASFGEASRYVLNYGGIQVPLPDKCITRTLGFILGYLMNSVDGALYNWLRNEKGWIYELCQWRHWTQKDFCWYMSFPLGSRDQVREVRRQLADRIAAALANQEQVERYASRYIDWLEAFSLETVMEIVDEAEMNLLARDEITPQAETRRMFKEAKDTALLQRIWNRLNRPENTGSFCSTPLAK